MKLGRAGTIGRFKPLHNGGAVMLETVCSMAEHVIIAVGSVNKYNARNPFTAEESKAMIDASLGKRFSNYSVMFIPDFGHLPEYRDGQKWRNHALEQFGELDYLVTGNDYVADLFRSDYKIIHPGVLIQREKQIMLRATEVRVEMAKAGNWEKLVPEEVAEYIKKNGLDKRFRQEFGLETLAMADLYWLPETREQEMHHAQEA
jgi:cytidyltransferase-like protein